MQELEKIISPQFQIQHKIFGHLTDNAKIEQTKDCDDILKENSQKYKHMCTFVSNPGFFLCADKITQGQNNSSRK